MRGWQLSDAQFQSAVQSDDLQQLSERRSNVEVFGRARHAGMMGSHSLEVALGALLLFELFHFSRS